MRTQTHEMETSRKVKGKICYWIYEVVIVASELINVVYCWKQWVWKVQHTTLYKHGNFLHPKTGFFFTYRLLDLYTVLYGDLVICD